MCYTFLVILKLQEVIVNDYIKLLTDKELTEFVLDYLRKAGFYNADLSIDRIDDIIVKRENGKAFVTIYFWHMEKPANKHCEYFEYESNLFGTKRVYPVLKFSLDSYAASCYNLYINEKIWKDAESVDEDLTRYLNYRMWKRFGKNYISDLKINHEKLNRKAYLNKQKESNNQIRAIMENEIESI